MAELEWSKEHCEKEDGTTHYDSFKKKEDIDKLATVASIFLKKKISPTVDTATAMQIFFLIKFHPPSI